MSDNHIYTFQEFFAGGGMVRQALGSKWKCIFANDFDGKKALAYQQNWGADGELYVGDIRLIDKSQFSTSADLAWASFPCQDLSLAGKGKGLNSERSGTFRVFWEKLILASSSVGLPKIVVIENVCGLLTSNSGTDFSEVLSTFHKNGYYAGALIIDAKEFLPQSRKRVFIIGVRNDLDVDPGLVSSKPTSFCHPKQLVQAFDKLDQSLKKNWLWFNVLPPGVRKFDLIDILEADEKVSWDPVAKTKSILDKMSEVNLDKVKAAQNIGRPVAGSLFFRTRKYKNQKKVFAEARFDGIAGCLRTPNGGSSRQSVLKVEGSSIKSRLITPRETARLMGLPDSYKLPVNKNAALHLTGDGVAVPVVAHLKECILENLLISQNQNYNQLGFVRKFG